MNERMPHGEMIENALVAQMHADLTRRRWWRTWWGRASVIAGVAFIGAASVAAFVLLQPSRVTDTQIVQCLGDPPRGADGRLTGTAVTVLTEDGELRVDDAVRACTSVWEVGFPDADPLEPSPGTGIVPSSFTMCVSDEGQPAVVPGTRDCAAIRLHPFQP